MEACCKMENYLSRHPKRLNNIFLIISLIFSVISIVVSIYSIKTGSKDSVMILIEFGFVVIATISTLLFLRYYNRSKELEKNLKIQTWGKRS